MNAFKEMKLRGDDLKKHRIHLIGLVREGNRAYGTLVCLLAPYLATLLADEDGLDAEAVADRVLGERLLEGWHPRRPLGPFLSRAVHKATGRAVLPEVPVDQGDEARVSELVGLVEVGNDARDELIVGLVPYVYGMVRQIGFAHGALDDAVQRGVAECCAKVEEWDPSRNDSLTGFLWKHIHGAILVEENSQKQFGMSSKRRDSIQMIISLDADEATPGVTVADCDAGISSALTRIDLNFAVESVLEERARQFEREVEAGRMSADAASLQLMADRLVVDVATGKMTSTEAVRELGKAKNLLIPKGYELKGCPGLTNAAFSQRKARFLQMLRESSELSDY